jgi:hypothetical protein
VSVPGIARRLSSRGAVNGRHAAAMRYADWSRALNRGLVTTLVAAPRLEIWRDVVAWFDRREAR